MRKDQHATAAALRDKKPRYTVDHIVKERFPTFMDAVRDMDDALCMIHLFANFPATKLLEKKRVAECARLSREFQHYVMKTRKLRKVFVSIKGIYYEAEVCNQPVVWVVPHAFTQTVRYPQLPGSALPQRSGSAPEWLLRAALVSLLRRCRRTWTTV